MRSDANARRILDGRAGKMLQARAGTGGALIELVARYAAPDGAQRQPQFTRLTITRGSDGWASRMEVAPLVGQARLASGTVRTSLFAATDEARIPDAVATQMTNEFIAIERDRVALMQSYLPKFNAAIPPTKVARYYQIENKLRAVVNFGLADAIPLVQ